MVRRDGQRTRAVHHLDVRGLLCPLPVRLAARELEGLPVGAELEIVGDDPVMRLDMPAFCDREGHRLLALDVAAGRVVVRLRKGGDARVPSVSSVERGGQSTR